MTIDEAIEELSVLHERYNKANDSSDFSMIDGDYVPALDKAIASLEAWEKIKQEINDLFNKPAYYTPNYDAYKMFLEIIDKHLQEVEE